MTLLALLTHLLTVLLATLWVKAHVVAPSHRSIQVTFDGHEWVVSGVQPDGTLDFLDSYPTRTAAIALAYRVAAHRNLPFSPS